MMWVLIYLAIAVAGLVMVGCFAIWLWRKAIALLRETGVLMERADQLAELLGQLGAPVDSETARRHHSGVDDDHAEDDVEFDLSRRQAT
jgi:NhaP-type Na+/H+ or K+/H+ antiporter